MKIFRMLLFVIAVVVLDNCNLFNNIHLLSSMSALAAQESDDPDAENTKKNLATYDDRASNPICGTASGWAIGAVTLAVASAIGAGIAYGLSATFPWMFGFGTLLTATAVLTVTQSMIYFACAYSFVRNPVIRNIDGDYLKCKEPEVINGDEKKTKNMQIIICPKHEYVKDSDYRWPENRAPYGDFIEFCHREALGGLNTAELDPREYQSRPKLVADKQAVGGSLACRRLKADENITLHSIRFGASYKGDKICVTGLGIGETNWYPQPEIGCHLREPSVPPPMCKDSVPIVDFNNKITGYDNARCISCYISNACAGSKGSFSHAPLPMTAIVVQCLKESLANVLSGCPKNDTQTPAVIKDKNSNQGTSLTNNEIGFLNIAKNKLSGTVKAVLALAVALFGMKILFGAIQSYTEVMLFIVKLALVIYFAIGDGMNFYYKDLVDISLGLADKIVSSAQTNEVCNYKVEDYIFPVFINNVSVSKNESIVYRKISLNNSSYKNINQIRQAKSALDEKNLLSTSEFDELVNKLTIKNYSYLAMWDKLDCRIIFYLGQSLNKGIGFSILSVLLLIPGLLFIGQIIITICILLFVMVLLMLIIWSVHLFVLSLIGLTIITLFAPLFVPMCLFQYTKGFFDGWIKELITFALYPVIIVAFLALVMATFDKLYFDDLKFVKVEDKTTDGTRAIYNYVLSPHNQCDYKPSNIACIVSGTNFITKPLIFGINVTAADMPKASEDLWQKFGKMALMGFFFWHFMKIISTLAAEIAGNFRANMGAGTMNPTETASNVAATAVSKIKGLASGKKDNNDKDGKDDKDNKKSRETISGSDSKESKGNDSDTKETKDGASRPSLSIPSTSQDGNDKSEGENRNSEAKGIAEESGNLSQDPSSISRSNIADASMLHPSTDGNQASSMVGNIANIADASNQNTGGGANVSGSGPNNQSTNAPINAPDGSSPRDANNAESTTRRRTLSANNDPPKDLED